MRRDIEFDAEGVTLRGWLYVPDGAGGPVPTVVMAHGLSAVKEMYLDSFAEAFAAGGWGRWCSTTGTSAPATVSRARRSTPGAQVRDYRHAITWAQSRPAVDAYVKDFDAASGAARDWFLQHLGSPGSE